jgi:hypothetical protein
METAGCNQAKTLTAELAKRVDLSASAPDETRRSALTTPVTPEADVATGELPKQTTARGHKTEKRRARRRATHPRCLMWPDLQEELGHE